MAFYGFEDNFINWIKLFNNTINAYVLQAGFLSKPIAIQRGCRQGDPNIAPYLFLMVAEVLNLLIERNTEINGLQIGKNMFKLTLFADDTTIILDGSASSLQATLNVLEIFGSLSGLKINCDKTKLIWIGSKKDSKENLNITSKLNWGSTEFTLLGLHFCTELEKIPEKNYCKTIEKAKFVLNSWRYRYLTPIGKITVIKTIFV